MFADEIRCMKDRFPSAKFRLALSLNVFLLVRDGSNLVTYNGIMMSLALRSVQARRAQSQAESLIG